MTLIKTENSIFKLKNILKVVTNEKAYFFPLEYFLEPELQRCSIWTSLAKTDSHSGNSCLVSVINSTRSSAIFLFLSLKNDVAKPKIKKSIMYFLKQCKKVQKSDFCMV